MYSDRKQFFPFFERCPTGEMFGYPSKITISLFIGALYMALQWYSLADKIVFFQQYCWILGVIISTSLLALYISTHLFRLNLPLIEKLQGTNRITDEIVNNWFSDKRVVLAGLAFATLNTSVAHVLGIPADFHVSPMPLTIIYLGYFVAGFCSGMGLYGIIGIIALYLKLAPNLQHALDYSDPDGSGGIKKLGDSLWFFAGLTGAVGILVSMYMFGVNWTRVYHPNIRLLLLFWVAFPYLVAISVVLIPGLAVKRSVGDYKKHMINKLKQENAYLFSSLKEFDDQSDEEIIEAHKRLNNRLNDIQQELAKLNEMRDSPIDKQ